MRTWPLTLALIAGLQAATAAQAATLTITADKDTYQVGESIVLSVHGDPQANIDVGVAGRILFDPALATYQMSTQETLTSFGGTVDWLLEPLSGGAGFADAFGQIFVGGAIPDGPLVATVSLLAASPGTLSYLWFVEAFDNWTLDFFGLSDAPGGSVAIVPEPATGVLLGLGLLVVACRAKTFNSGPCHAGTAEAHIHSVGDV